MTRTEPEVSTEQHTAPRMTAKHLDTLRWLTDGAPTLERVWITDGEKEQLRDIAEFLTPSVSGDTVKVPTEVLQNIAHSANAISNLVSRSKFPAVRNHAEYIESNANRILSASRTSGEKR